MGPACGAVHPKSSPLDLQLTSFLFRFSSHDVASGSDIKPCDKKDKPRMFIDSATLCIYFHYYGV